MLVVVCLLFAARSAAASPVPRTARITAARLDPRVRGKYAETTLDGMLAFPVQNTTTVVYLHGIHGLAANGCPWMRSGGGSLVCPEANVALPNGTFSWSGRADVDHAVVARAERAARGSSTVLVGFSQGAYVATDIVEAGLGKYRGLVLLSADVSPSAKALADAGIRRVVLGAGELDGSFAPMKKTAERLAREGVEVRFVSLGRVGHTYQAEDREALAAAIAWACGDDGAPAARPGDALVLRRLTAGA
jgi:hypothetical protein